MKSRLLLAALLAAPALFAQTQHVIQWSMATTTEQASLTIPEGDEVLWLWADPGPYSVTSTGGTDTFDSGVMDGPFIYSHVFEDAGETDYHCTEHPNLMLGTITVTGTTGIKDARIAEFKVFPNPVTDLLTITSPDVIIQVEVFDINGRLVLSAPTHMSEIKLYTTGFEKGNYVVKATTANGEKSMMIVKD